MFQKLKKIFLNFRCNKKQLFFAVLSCVCLGIMAPISLVYGITELITTPLFFAAKVAIVIGLSFHLFSLANAFLGWVIGPNLIEVGFTTAENQFVTIGWTLVRDLTNMFFILIVVAIGLATALRIKDYEAKKTIPILIAIALLINFTPVICGVIIDGSNIVMNFFLGGEATGLEYSVNSATILGEDIKKEALKSLKSWQDWVSGAVFIKIILIIPNLVLPLTNSLSTMPVFHLLRTIRRLLALDFAAVFSACCIWK